MKQYSSFAGADGASTGLGSSKIAVLPVPYDKTSTWIKGADKGPFALIEASGALEMYDIETDCEVSKQGIYTCSPLIIDSSPEKMVEVLEEEVAKLLNADKFVVTLGGEHSVSIGAAKAHNTKFKDLSVLQLDAHLDLRDEYEGTRFNHACVMSRIRELCPIVQVGIRSMCFSEKNITDRKDVFFAADIAERDGWVDNVVERLSDNVYVTIDLDVFDPSIMPSTGTPEPGGLTWYQIIRLLGSLAIRKKITGFDVVELCPNSNNKAPDFMAAKLVYKFLSCIYGKNKN